VAALMLHTTGMAERADLAALSPIWAPAEQLSLAARADAASKAANDLPRRSRLIHIWGFSPTEADRIMSEWADEELLAAAITAQRAGAPSSGQDSPAQVAAASFDRDSEYRDGQLSGFPDHLI
jgi:hypothetical protein